MLQAQVVNTHTSFSRLVVRVVRVTIVDCARPFLNVQQANGAIIAKHQIAQFVTRDKANISQLIISGGMYEYSSHNYLFVFWLLVAGAPSPCDMSDSCVTTCI